MGNNITKKFAAIALSAATVAWLSGAALLVPVAHAQTSLQGQIDALLAQIAALQAQLAAGSSSSVAACSFTRDLTLGVKGDDVMCLQKYLNSTGHKVSTSGPGSPGSETSYFGSLTASAVAKWQAANGVAPAAGYFGRISRAKYSALAAAAPAPAPVPGTTPAPVPSGSGLSVSLASDQPASGLFGESFASRPFTKLTFVASADGDVVVKALTVERQGQGNDSAFNGVVALDEDGIRLGPAKTFGSDHRLRLSEKFTVKAGQSRTITLAGDSDADQNDYAGQLVKLALVGVEVDGSAAVNAAFPLAGNLMTINDTLAIGSLTIAKGSFDPGSGLTKEIGTTGYTFSGLRLSAGTNEDVLVKSISWNQSGSAGISDLGNVKVVFDGVTYDATASSDGKYYTAKFGSGIKIDKGLNKEVYVKADVLGGSARTVDFDLYRYSDIQVLGLTYGYTLLPSGTELTADNDDDSEIQNAEPRFDASQSYIDAGTISAQNAPTVGAQNIAINLPNQPLGGLLIDVKGEDVTVAAINFDLSIVDDSGTGGTIDTNDVTNITLVDEDGKVVAGPTDGVAGGNNAVRFTDTVTFKPGRKVYTLKGKVGTDVGTNDTIAASTTPSSDWTTVRGVTSAVSITPTPSSAVTMSTMTVKAASLAITVSAETKEGTNASSTAQTVVAGISGYEFTKYVLDASGSGEDIRINALQLRNTFSSANAADDVTSCQLYDGATALNTGSNAVNPSNSDTSPSNKTFTFDSSLVIPKGTVKTLGLKCNLISGAASGHQWQWGITDADASVTATGVTSGQSVDGSDAITADDGRVITAATSGSLALVLDTSSPALKWVQSGTTDNVFAVLRLNATNEDVRVDTLGLQLATSTNNAADATVGNASNSPSDLSKVTIWNGSTKVGEAVFTANDYATATLSGVTVPKDGQVLLTVKADMAAIGTNLAARPGHLVTINYDAQSSSDETNTGAVGVGLSSGTTIGSGGSDTAANGARLARAVPTISLLSLPSTSLNGGATSNLTIFRYKVTAPSGTNGVSLYKTTFNIATSTASLVDQSQSSDTSSFRVTNFKLYCYSNVAFDAPSCGTFDNSGLLNQGGLARDTTDGDTAAGTADTNLSLTFNPTDSTGGSTAEAIQLAAGETKYFALVADVTGASNTPSITTKLQGDATFSAGGAKVLSVDGSAADDITIDGDNWSTGRYVFATTAAHTDSWQDDDFIWSGNSTNTSQSIVDYDWFNGFLVPGLSNADQGTTLSVVGN